jgi:hypothetical protein
LERFDHVSADCLLLIVEKGVSFIFLCRPTTARSDDIVESPEISGYIFPLRRGNCLEQPLR